MTNLKSTFYEDIEMQEIMKEFFEKKKSYNITYFCQFSRKW